MLMPSGNLAAIGLGLLVLSTCSACSSERSAPPAGVGTASDLGAETRATGTESARTTDSDTAEPVGTLHLTLANGSPVDLGSGFLLDRGGRPVVVASKSRLGPLTIETWEQNVSAAALRLGDHELALGAPACAGLDHFASGVLMLAVKDLPLDLEPLSPSPRVPAPGERVDFGPDSTATVLTVYSDGYLDLDSEQDVVPVGTPVIDVDGEACAVVTSIEESEQGKTVVAQLLLPFLNTPARLAGTSSGTVAPPLVQSDRSPDGRLLSAGTPPLNRLVVVDSIARRPYAALEKVDDARRFGLGVFPDEGFTFVAVGQGRSELFELESGLPLAWIDAPSGQPREVHTEGARLAISSAEELVVVDLEAFRIERRLPGTFGPVLVTGSRVLVGARDSILAFGPDPEAPPLVVAELGTDENGAPRVATALARSDGTLWIGSAHALLSVPDDGQRHAARVRLETGEGTVNAIAVDGGQVWIGTGALIEDEVGDLVSADCYVRVLDATTGAEIARSHDHGTPLRALMADPSGWLGVVGDGTAWRWQRP